MGQFQILTRHLSGATEENHENLHSRESLGRDLNPVGSSSITHSDTAFGCLVGGTVFKRVKKEADITGLKLL